MTTLPVIAGVFRVAINWANGPAIATNVMHFSAPTLTPTTLAAALDANFVSGMCDTVSSTFAAQTCSITPLDGASATSDHGLSAWVGGGGSDYTPANSVVVKLSTALRGKYYRGRVYLPATAETACTAGFISGAQATAVGNHWNTFVNDMAGDGAQLVIASYTLATAEDVLSCSVTPATCTQRRRQERLRP